MSWKAMLHWFDQDYAWEIVHYSSRGKRIDTRYDAQGNESPTTLSDDLIDQGWNFKLLASHVNG